MTAGSTVCRCLTDDGVKKFPLRIKIAGTLLCTVFWPFFLVDTLWEDEEEQDSPFF